MKLFQPICCKLFVIASVWADKVSFLKGSSSCSVISVRAVRLYLAACPPAVSEGRSSDNCWNFTGQIVGRKKESKLTMYGCVWFSTQVAKNFEDRNEFSFKLFHYYFILFFFPLEVRFSDKEKG